MIKIVKSTKDNVTTYQVVDAAWEDIPENRGKPASTVLEAVNLWLSPNNDESEIAKFLAEVPIVEEERPTESRMPKDFNDCLLPLRLDNCAMCSYKPQRGVNWKTCMLRVRMFRAEGGAYLGV